MPTHDEIYREQAERYEEMIRRQPDLSEVVNAICSFEGLDVLDLGAGTGRLSTFLAQEAGSLLCTDASQAMLDVLDRKLTELGIPRNWKTLAADHRRLPIPDRSFDLAVSGWSICYLASSSRPDWRRDLGDVIAELRRVLRPNGTIVIFETMGTGTETPAPPDFLTAYYAALEEEYGFKHRWIRMDYRFDSAAEAKQRTEFFFGEALAQQVEVNDWATVPECAGVWWATFP